MGDLSPTARHTKALLDAGADVMAAGWRQFRAAAAVWPDVVACRVSGLCLISPTRTLRGSRACVNETEARNIRSRRPDRRAAAGAITMLPDLARQPTMLCG
jgi:hypothetical protein